MVEAIGICFYYIGKPVQFGLHIPRFHPAKQNHTGMRMKVFEDQFAEVAFVIGDDDPLQIWT